MTEQIIRTAFKSLLNENRWCAWRSADRNGKPTKMPVCRTGAAKPNDPCTWMGFEAAFQLSKRSGIAGLGVFLGPRLEAPTEFLIGIDVDTCINEKTEHMVSWAAELVESTPMYWEVSPSGTGLKGFALVRQVDLDAFSDVLNNNYCKTWKQAGAKGEHPPCIDLYSGARYFTVTGRLLKEANQSVPILSRTQLDRVINDFGPKLAGKPNRRPKASERKQVRNEAKQQPSVCDNHTEGALASDPLDQMRDWALSEDILPFREAYRLLTIGAVKEGNDASRSAQEFAFSKVARLAGLNRPEFEIALRAWSEEGFGFGENGSDERADDDRQRAWDRCWEKTSSSRLPIFVADRDKNALFIQKSEGKEQTYVKLSSYVQPIHELVDETGEHARCFEIGTRTGTFKNVIVPCKAWSGRRDDFIEILTKEGLFHATYQSARSDLRSWVNGGRPALAKLVTRSGWVDESAFALPGRVINPKEGPTIIEQIAPADGFGTFGTLEDWQETVAKTCIGNSRLILTLCAAFLGPLMKPVGIESGGLHINGSSSIGKSTALRVSASVFGSRDFVKTWRATDNGLEGIAESRSDTCLLLDELSEATPATADRVAYMLANGRGKDRANRDGSSRPAKHWRITFISSGEVSLSDKLGEVGKYATAGQQVRVLDIPADTDSGFGLFDTIHQHKSASAFAEALSEAALQAYGTAGNSFITKLIENRDASLACFTEAKREFSIGIGDETDDGQVRRGQKRFAAIAAAGEVAIRLGILPWKRGDAIWGVSRCFEDWIKNRGHNGSVEEQRCIEVIKHQIETRGNNVFQSISDGLNEADKVRDRAGFYERKADGSTTYYFLSPSWNQLFQSAGLNARTAAKLLGRRNYLERGDGDRWQIKMDLSKHGLSKNSRVYAISSKILDAG
ncbi:MAG: DUF927 domain-containing protein [Pseudomonadota bacterium]